MANGEVKFRNIDILGLISRADRMAKELGDSQSAELPNGLIEHDKARILDYIGDYKAYLDYVGSTPTPDTPEAHGGFELPVPDNSHIQDPLQVENEDIRQLLYQFQVYRIEMAEAQSVVLIQGFINHQGATGDRQRFLDGILRVENMVNYIGNTQPSDRPESTPKRKGTTT